LKSTDRFQSQAFHPTDFFPSLDNNAGTSFGAILSASEIARMAQGILPPPAVVLYYIGMNESDDTQLTSISKARTMEEIADFWDTHSLADYWDQTHKVQFEVRAKRRRRVTLAPEVYAGVEAQARARGIVPETLVNLWLIERLQSDVA